MKSRAKRALFLLSLMVFTTFAQFGAYPVYAADDCTRKGYEITVNTIPDEKKHDDAGTYEVVITKAGANFDSGWRLVSLDLPIRAAGFGFRVGTSEEIARARPADIQPNSIRFEIDGKAFFPDKWDQRAELSLELWDDDSKSDGTNKCTVYTYIVKPNIYLSCEWAPLNNPSSPYNGAPAYCFNGFIDKDDLRQASVTFECVGAACGSGLRGDGLKTKHSYSGVDNSNIACDPGTGCFTCSIGMFDDLVRDSFYDCVNRKRVYSVAAGAVGATFLTGIAAGATGGGALLLLPAGAVSFAGATGAASKVTDTILGECAPVIRATGVDKDGVECISELKVTPTMGGGTDLDLGNNNDNDPEIKMKANFAIQQYELCDQVPGIDSNNATPKGKCFECLEAEGIWTAVGCVPSDLTGLVGAVVAIGLSIGGGIALLMIIIAAYMFSISQGDPKKTNMGKEILTAAIVGLLFVIFSITMLRIIAVDVIVLPGFGT